MSKLTILRGLPGSGKSTTCNRLDGVVVSADHYFIDENGEYQFDGSKIGEAHAACQASALKAMQKGLDVVVDNTNVELWEYQVYLDMAKRFGYSVEIIDIFDSGHTDEELHARNTHDVPLDTIKRMRARYEH